MPKNRQIRSLIDAISKFDPKLWLRIFKQSKSPPPSDATVDKSSHSNSILWGYIPVALVALIGLSITFGLVIQSMNWENRQVEISFQEIAQDRILLIQREIKYSLGILQDIASFIEASETISRREFRKFVGPALKNQAGIKSLAWVPRVDAKDYKDFIEIAKQSFPPFKIKEHARSADKPGDKLPKRSVYYPILYVQPYADNKQMLGLNLDSDPQTASLIQQTLSEKKPQIITKSITDPLKQLVMGITIVVPVFFDTASEQKAEASKTLRGFVTGTFSIGDIVERALENLRPGAVDIQLYQENTGAEATHIYTHFSRVRSQQQFSENSYQKPELSYSQKISVENQVWSITCSPVAERFEVKTHISWIIFFSGIAFTALLTIYTATLVGRANQIRLQVAERTTQLRSIVEELNQEVMERKATESELQTLNETLESHIASRTAEAERKAEYLEQFAYVTSHDLKAPLRAVSNLAEWIEEDLQAKLDSSSREQLALLRDRVRRMHDLIEGLLEYSRVGKTSDIKSNIDTYELIQEITDSLSPQKGFSIKIKSDMPVLVADRLQLGQVFANLIGNSLKHHGGKKGKIQITSQKVGDFYEFSVRDNGQGIAPEYHEKVFKMFQTLKSSDYGNSTGIGLALVKKIVVEHGGSIRLESANDKGACFTFSWPILDQGPDPDQLTPEALHE